MLLFCVGRPQRVFLPVNDLVPLLLLLLLLPLFFSPVDSAVVVVYIDAKQDGTYNPSSDG